MKADHYTIALVSIVAIVAIVALANLTETRGVSTSPVALPTSSVESSETEEQSNVGGAAVSVGLCKPETYCSDISTVVHKDLFCTLSSYGCDWGCDAEENICRKRPSE